MPSSLRLTSHREDRDRVDSEEAYRRIYQSNSGALYFSQCEDPNETWLPLLEKCYAKAHGDYSAIEGGFTGEGIEDLTGGVTTEIYTADILDREAFWRDELMQVNKEFLFGCSTGIWGRGRESQGGILALHAYSVMRAVEAEGERLVLLKNPWGKGEWKGPWSDGSKEWTSEWLQRLNHKFGDDGAFWISYSDLLRKYQAFDRTRLFGDDWRVASLWTTLAVPWKHDYHDTHFAFTLATPGEVIIVLSQLDDRYFRGLEGQYVFNLAFRLHRSGQEDYIVRTPPAYRMKRSVNVEVKLEAGDYTVMVKVDAARDDRDLPIEEVIRANAKTRRDKLLRIGLAYDLAHSKGRYVETPEEEKARVAHEERAERRRRREAREELTKRKVFARYMFIKKEQRFHKDGAKAREVEACMKRRECRRTRGRGGRSGRRGRGSSGSPHYSPSPREGDRVDRRCAEPHSRQGTRPAPLRKPSPPPDEPPQSHGLDRRSESHPPPTELKNPDERKTPEPENGENGDGDQVSLGERTPRKLRRGSEMESFRTALPDLQPVMVEEPQAYFSDSASISSDSATVSTVSVSEREIDFEVETRELRAAQSPPSTPPQPTASGPVPVGAEVEGTPWNAVVVAGLRIYHKIPEGGAQDEEAVKLQVVRPVDFSSSEYEGSGSEAEEAEKKVSRKLVSEASKGLDVDDSAKDATLEGTENERKMSIDPKAGDNRGKRRSRMVPVWN